MELEAALPEWATFEPSVELWWQLFDKLEVDEAARVCKHCGAVLLQSLNSAPMRMRHMDPVLASRNRTKLQMLSDAAKRMQTQRVLQAARRAEFHGCAVTEQKGRRPS